MRYPGDARAERLNWRLLAASVVGAAVFTIGASISSLPARSDSAAAIATILELGTDKSRLEAYCAVAGQMQAPGLDQSAVDTLGETLDRVVRSMGPAYAAALDLHYELDDNSPDGAALIGAFEKLDAQCAKAP